MLREPLSARRRLLRWYDRSRRALPWRESQDPWKILVSEIMLQQTRVEAVLPYYRRFLDRFPDARSLAAASEADVLAAWSGLGYYSRARNLQRAARAVADSFPASYEAIRALPGVGPYTAAAVASIAFNLPHAALDGNVLRVLARLTGDDGDIGSPRTRERFAAAALELLDPRRPGDFNQAMMELGATVCLPRSPHCLVCPVSRNCVARQEGRQGELPVKARKIAPRAAELAVAVLRRGGRILLRQRAAEESRMSGFWELPELAMLPRLQDMRSVAAFQHTIVNTAYKIEVFTGQIARVPKDMCWTPMSDLDRIPLTTISKKALALAPPAGQLALRAREH